MKVNLQDGETYLRPGDDRADRARSEDMAVQVKFAKDGLLVIHVTNYSHDDPPTYIVQSAGDHLSCTCPDHQYRELVCKHMRKAMSLIQEH